MEKQEVAIRSQSNVPSFVQKATESIEAMMDYADVLLRSKLCPAHFYDKVPGKNEPDYTKGNPAAVVMVLQHGLEVGLSPMQSLQQVVPVKGLISIKGDGAKSLIFRSGVLESGSWKEEISGSIDEETYTVTISAKRKDNGLHISRSFSVDMAKRAGLWIGKEKLSGQDGWKWKMSSWYKYPARMIMYRAIGFISRDGFMDVLAGMYTTEEAQDMPQDLTTVIDATTGAQIKIPDKDFNQERSKKLTQRAMDKIDERNKPPQAQAEVPPEYKHPTHTPDPHTQKMMAQADSTPEPDPGNDDGVYTEDELVQKSTDELTEICEAIPAMKIAMAQRAGRNTNKKLRTIILDYQNGLLREAEPPAEQEEAPEDEQEEADDIGLEAIEVPEDEPQYDYASNENIEPDLDFDKEKPEESEPKKKVYNPEKNPYDLEVSELPESGARDFAEAARLYGAMNTINPPLTDNRFIEVVDSLLTVKGKYKDKEDFCKKGSIGDINFVLEKHKEKG